MKRILIVSIVAAFCMFAQNADAQIADEAAVLERLGGAMSGIQSMKCEFVQTKRSAMLDGDLVVQGMMYYRQGGLLRWEYVSPEFSMIMNGTLVSFSGEGRNDVMDINQSKMFKEIGRIMMNCMLGRSLTDESGFSVNMSETDDEWIARLDPLRREMKRIFSEIVLHFDKKSCYVNAIELNESGGDSTLIEFSEVLTDIDIDDSVFEIMTDGE